ncbi:hypothetical protein [Pseudomonas sp. CGJS7]|uniref:hypothetical protein n=1 Tax=Pseudomonas sp. CGJS7 TaxID=3109348 RepID=UPI00300B9A1B
MAKPDFTKTSSQLERQVFDLIDAVDRSLDSSNGDSQRNGHYVFTALVSIVIVFASILGIDYLVGGKKPASAGRNAVANGSRHDMRDLELMGQHLTRIERQSSSIREIKSRVAPSMPIDSQLDVIANSVDDLRRLEGVPAPANATATGASH